MTALSPIYESVAAPGGSWDGGLAWLLLGPEDRCGLGACCCLARGCCDEVRQRQCGGNGDDDRGERDIAWQATTIAARRASHQRIRPGTAPAAELPALVQATSPSLPIRPGRKSPASRSRPDAPLTADQRGASPARRISRVTGPRSRSSRCSMASIAPTAMPPAPRAAALRWRWRGQPTARAPRRARRVARAGGLGTGRVAGASRDRRRRATKGRLAPRWPALWHSARTLAWSAPAARPGCRPPGTRNLGRCSSRARSLCAPACRCLLFRVQDERRPDPGGCPSGTGGQQAGEKQCHRDDEQHDRQGDISGSMRCMTRSAAGTCCGARG